MSNKSALAQRPSVMHTYVQRTVRSVLLAWHRHSRRAVGKHPFGCPAIVNSGIHVPDLPSRFTVRDFATAAICRPRQHGGKGIASWNSTPWFIRLFAPRGQFFRTATVYAGTVPYRTDEDIVGEVVTFDDAWSLCFFFATDFVQWYPFVPMENTACRLCNRSCK